MVVDRHKFSNPTRDNTIKAWTLDTHYVSKKRVFSFQYKVWMKIDEIFQFRPDQHKLVQYLKRMLTIIRQEYTLILFFYLNPVNAQHL